MRKIAAFGLVAVFAATLSTQGSVFAADGAPIPATPPFASPDIKPTLCDWLTARPIALAKKVALTDPLQKPPFVGQPPDSLKGMAAGIRAVQLDAPNRAKAAAYLGTVDCVTYPQAQAMLIATMQDDPAEEVRYEAVMALRNMMSHGCSNLDSECECEKCRGMKKVSRETERHTKKMQNAVIHEAKGKAKKEARKANKVVKETRYDCCRGCCNAKVLNALAEVAYGKDEFCCYVEPSERIREAAAEGMSLCCTNSGGGYMPTVDPIPPVTDPVDPEVMPNDDKETTPDSNVPVEAPIDPKTTALPPAPVTVAPRAKVSTVTVAPKALAVLNEKPIQTPATPAPTQVSELKGTKTHPVLTALNGFCIVGLKERQFIPARSEFSTQFEDRTYYFSSADAKEEFLAEPTYYAPAYGGIDPVVWMEKHEMVEGKFLREYEGRFYLFSDKEMWQAFKNKPQRFVLNRPANSSRDLAGR